MFKTRITVVFVLAALALTACKDEETPKPAPKDVAANAPAEESVPENALLKAKVRSVIGMVEREKSDSWKQLRVGKTVVENDHVRTALESELVVNMTDGSTLRVPESSNVTFQAELQDNVKKLIFLDIHSGKVHFDIQKQEQAEIYFKTGTATVAKWAFTTDNTTGNITCELDETYDPDTLVSGKIAPGTSGKCPVTVSNANSEVGIRYDITPSTVTNQPTNLKFYADASHTTEITSGATVNGTLIPGASDTVYVYWNWPYQDGTEAYDTADTTNGVAGSTMTITLDVVGTQVQPSV